MADETTTRRRFLHSLACGALSLTLSDAAGAQSPRASGKREMLVYVGTYTAGKSEGIYLLRLNLSSGELRHVGTTKGVANPSFLTLDGRRRYLYAVNEVEEFAGKKSGAVSAFAVDQKTGGLRFLNQQPSQGGAPCYVSLDAGGDGWTIARRGRIVAFVGSNLMKFGPLLGELLARSVLVDTLPSELVDI